LRRILPIYEGNSESLFVVYFGIADLRAVEGGGPWRAMEAEVRLSMEISDHGS
jgi:hypothetical protein